MKTLIGLIAEMFSIFRETPLTNFWEEIPACRPEPVRVETVTPRRLNPDRRKRNH
ncbi:MAG TPA: hypothetical protein PKJ28_05870 [Bacteroidales bacterium]|nr:hypothetical protein [Bacteroidales bacterium]HPS74083.1 hypothetical protein [Bacteroidales bacterium]